MRLNNYQRLRPLCSFFNSGYGNKTSKNNELLIKLHAAGINPVDWKLRDGLGRGMITPPYTLGFDVSGVVEAIGDGVERFEVGRIAVVHRLGDLAIGDVSVAVAAAAPPGPGLLPVAAPSRVPASSAALARWRVHSTRARCRRLRRAEVSMPRAARPSR